MAPTSPGPKLLRQREQTMPAALTQDVTLPQLVADVAGLHARFARDEVFVTGVHDAVDHSALIHGTFLMRLALMEGKIGAAESVVSQPGFDAKANDERLDANLRKELDAVISLLGDELRAENVKMQEAFVNLKGVALGAV